MAIQTISDLKALINSTIYDNTTHEISGSDVQTALINAIDTLDSAEGFINVHKANGQTTITAYGSKADARAAVPTDFHYQGIVIAYKLSSGWLIEHNLDATSGTWANDASWQTIGPVSVSQNNQTGHTDITIGSTTTPVASVDDINVVKANFGGIDLQKISFLVGKYVNTSGDAAPNDGTNITYTENGTYNCAVIPATEGNVFLLNLVGGYSWARTYSWAKADFSFISKSPSSYTCDEENVVAPPDTAYLILNARADQPISCYMGDNFKYYVDHLVSVSENSATEIDTIKIGSAEKDVSSDMASRRLMGAVVLATGSAALDSAGSAAQNIIPSRNVNIKKGTLLQIDVSGLLTYHTEAELFINGSTALILNEPSVVYQCNVDVTAIRVIVRKSYIIANGSVSASINVLNVYNSFSEVTKKLIDNNVTDVYGRVPIDPNWKHTFLVNNISDEYASNDYITSDYIPTDNIAYLRMDGNVSFTLFIFNRDKELISRTDYSGPIVLSFNTQIKFGGYKYIRIRANTGNTSNVSVFIDSMASRFNNKRLLGNKNIKSFGHRGSSISGRSSADNYPSSIWGAYINGFEGVHVNVQFTTDNVPYCLHDATFVDDVTGNTITLCDSTSEQIDACLRNGEPIAKVESAVYMAKMMGLDVILYNIYGAVDPSKIDGLIGLVKKYDIFEHTYFGVSNDTYTAYYLQQISLACPKANILRTQADISSTDYSQISALITDAETILGTYPDLNIYLWLYDGHPEANFIQANMDKPYNVHLAAFGVTEAHYAMVLPYVSIYTSNIGEWSFGTRRRNIEVIVTDKYPEFLLGQYCEYV